MATAPNSSAAVASFVTEMALTLTRLVSSCLSLGTDAVDTRPAAFGLFSDQVRRL
jgi:hypothetical protein